MEPADNFMGDYCPFCHSRTIYWPIIALLPSDRANGQLSGLLLSVSHSTDNIRADNCAFAHPRKTNCIFLILTRFIPEYKLTFRRFRVLSLSGVDWSPLHRTRGFAGEPIYWRAACEIVGWAKQPSNAHFTSKNDIKMCKQAGFAQP